MKRMSRTKKAIWYVINAVNGVIFGSSAFSIFNNQGKVETWIWGSLIGSALMIFILIISKKFITDESLAFGK